MGMYDYVEGVGQVKCFDCNLNSYNIGDSVPYESKGYLKDLIIMNEDLEMPEYKRASNCDWSTGSITIIKDGIVEESVKVKDFRENDDIIKGFQVIDSGGSKLNISDMNDLFLFVKERIEIAHKVRMMKLDFEISGILKNIDDYSMMNEIYFKEEEITKAFYDKWYNGNCKCSLMIL